MKRWFVVLSLMSMLCMGALAYAKGPEVDLVAEKLISPKDAVLMVEPESLSQLLAPIFDPKDWKALAVATKGLPAGKQIVATIETSMGSLECTLFDDKAPITVANWLGLASESRFQLESALS